MNNEGHFITIMREKKNIYLTSQLFVQIIFQGKTDVYYVLILHYNHRDTFL
jgi:hypothetical protein